MNAHFLSLLDHIAQSAVQGVETLGGKPIDIAPELAHMEATVRDTPVHMRSQAWSGGKFRLFRLTRLYGRVQMLNFVAYPHTGYDSPIFATDIVVLGDKLRVCYIDAMPLFTDNAHYAAKWIAPFDLLGQQSQHMAERYDLKLDWSHHFIGPSACLMTELPLWRGNELLQLWNGYWHLYQQLMRHEQAATAPQAAAAADWHHRYNHEHADVESQRNPIFHYFGRELGERYIREFLFSETLGEKH